MEQARAVLHLAFICELYQIQVHGGQNFFHTHSHAADNWEQPTVTGSQTRFRQWTDWSMFGPNVPHGMNTLTRWLTNSGCIAQALSSSTHSSTLRQTITSAMSQQLQTDLCAAGTTDPPQHRPLLPKLGILAVDADEAPLEDGKRRTMSRVDHLTHTRSKLLVKMRSNICETTGTNRTQPSWPKVDRYPQS